MPGAERRRQTRFKVKACFLKCSEAGLLSFLKKPGGDPLPVLNLSTGGVEFATTRDLKPGRKLRISMEVPAFGELLKFSAEVRWTKAVPHRKLFRVGVKFARVDGETAKKLRDLEADPMMRGILRVGEGLL